ncbi:ribonuclease P protein component [Candidatus Peregrinibacteria bacterium]|nr:ribonuclease P protein component [Candidatus Peregrinibacteria bacterium]
MLFPKNRLRDKKTIQALLSTGKWIKDRHFTLKFRLPSPSPASDGRPQAVIVISAKTEKRATERNRLRRQITEALRHFLDEYRVPYQLAVIPRSSALKLSYGEIRDSLHYLLKKII